MVYPSVSWTLQTDPGTGRRWRLFWFPLATIWNMNNVTVYIFENMHNVYICGSQQPSREIIVESWLGCIMYMYLYVIVRQIKFGREFYLDHPHLAHSTSITWSLTLPNLLNRLIWLNFEAFSGSLFQLYMLHVIFWKDRITRKLTARMQKPASFRIGGIFLYVWRHFAT